MNQSQKSQSSLAMMLLFLLLPILSVIPRAETQAAGGGLLEFRPFYEPYGKGSIFLDPDVNTSSISRSWNLEGLNVSEFYWILRLLVPSSWVYEGGGTHLDPGFDLFMYVSTDNGTTYPDVLNWDIGTTIYTMDKSWEGGFAYVDISRTLLSTDLELFTPSTRIKLNFHRGYSTMYPTFYLANAYWGATQKPVPPFDYVDAEGSFVQFHLKFYAVYTLENITYTGSFSDFPYNQTKSYLTTSCESIIDSFLPSGVINEVTGKTWGRETWNVLYSGQLAAQGLLEARSIINDTRYLIFPKRFIAYQFSKQLSDGSFYFILTDGDEHPWYNATTDMWYGYDKIDSFSALSISLAKAYWDATNDTTFIDSFWSQILKSKDFVYSLVNQTSWIVRDGYHFNGTDYNLSEWSLLHDCVEVWQGLKDLAYLYRYMKLDTGEADYWDAFSGSLGAGIKTKFWNETLDRYVGFVHVPTNAQDTTLIYNIITPILYSLETNETRASLTLATYISWGNLSGRYYDKDWAADYSVYNEYSTMSGMIFSGLALMNSTYGLSDFWLKEKVVEVSKFLLNNPIYPWGLLQNSRGFLDYVNLINYTWANDYARLVEANAWIIRGLMQLAPVSSLFNFTYSDMTTLNATLADQEVYFNGLKKQFHNETGMLWYLDCYHWHEWLKDIGRYVNYYDFMFWKMLRDEWIFKGLPWWEIITPPVNPITCLEIPSYVDDYTVLAFGLVGIFLMIFSPTWAAWKIRKSGADVSTVERFGYAMLLFMVGLGLFITFLYW